MWAEIEGGKGGRGWGIGDRGRKGRLWAGVEGGKGVVGGELGESREGIGG